MHEPSIVQTDDGSYTFFSSDYSEHYHSVTGAIEESFEKFVKPCRISDGMNLLDICFGLGYNSCAAMDTARGLNIVALEKDFRILSKISQLDPDFKNYSIIKSLVKGVNSCTKLLRYSDSSYKIKILVGNALQTIKSISEISFDAVFLDPFSPRKCPELWTHEFFKDIIGIMKPKGILATYSCAKIVRSNLKKAGFTVKDGPCVGRRSPSTVAVKP